MSDSTPAVSPQGGLTTDDPAPDLERIVEIRNPAVDVTQVMADIRETLRQHGPFQQPNVPAFGMVPDEGTDALAFHLQQANLNYDQVFVEVNVIRPRIPVIGGLVMRTKTLLHELAVYYVNLHAGQQINVNASLVRALNVLAQSREQELAVLRSEVARLAERIAVLESKQ